MEGLEYFIDDIAIQVLHIQQTIVKDIAVFDERLVFSNVSDLLYKFYSNNPKLADSVAHDFTNMILKQHDIEDNKDVFNYPIPVFPVMTIKKRLFDTSDAKVSMIYHPDHITSLPQPMNEYLSQRYNLERQLRKGDIEDTTLNTFNVPFQQTGANKSTSIPDVIYAWRLKESDALVTESMRVLPSDKGIIQHGFISFPSREHQTPKKIDTDDLFMQNEGSIDIDTILQKPCLFSDLKQLPLEVEVRRQSQTFTEPYEIYKTLPHLYDSLQNVNELVVRSTRERMSARYRKTATKRTGKKERKTKSLWTIIVKDVNEQIENIKSKTLTRLHSITEVKANKLKKAIKHQSKSYTKVFYSFREAQHALDSFENNDYAAIVDDERLVIVKKQDNAWVSQKSNERETPAYVIENNDISHIKDTFKTSDDRIEQIENMETYWNQSNELYANVLKPTGLTEYYEKKRKRTGAVIGQVDLSEVSELKEADEGYDRNFTAVIHEVAQNTAMIFEGITLDAASNRLVQMLRKIHSLLALDFAPNHEAYILRIAQSKSVTRRQAKEEQANEMRRNVLERMVTASLMLAQSMLPLIVFSKRGKKNIVNIDDDAEVIEYAANVFIQLCKSDKGYRQLYDKRLALTAVVEDSVQKAKNMFSTVWQEILSTHVDLAREIQHAKDRMATLRTNAEARHSLSSKYHVWSSFLPHPERKAGRTMPLFFQHKHHHLPLISIPSRKEYVEYSFENNQIKQKHFKKADVQSETSTVAKHTRFYLSDFVQQNNLFKGDTHINKLVLNCDSLDGWREFAHSLSKPLNKEDPSYTNIWQDLYETLRKSVLVDLDPHHAEFYINFIRCDICQTISRIANRFKLKEETGKSKLQAIKKRDDSFDFIISEVANRATINETRRTEMKEFAQDMLIALDNLIYAVSQSSQPKACMYLIHYVLVTILTKACVLLPNDCRKLLVDRLLEKSTNLFKTRKEVLDEFERDREKKKQAKILTMRGLDNQTRRYIKEMQGRGIIRTDDILTMDLSNPLLHAFQGMNVENVNTKQSTADDEGYDVFDDRNS